MILERGIGISSAKTSVNWLHKWANRAVGDGKISAFLLQAGKPKVLTNLSAFTKKKMILKMFNPPPPGILLVSLYKKWILLQLLK